MKIKAEQIRELINVVKKSGTANQTGFTVVSFCNGEMLAKLEDGFIVRWDISYAGEFEPFSIRFYELRNVDVVDGEVEFAKDTIKETFPNDDSENPTYTTQEVTKHFIQWSVCGVKKKLEYSPDEGFSMEPMPENWVFAVHFLENLSECSAYRDIDNVRGRAYSGIQRISLNAEGEMCATNGQWLITASDVLDGRSVGKSKMVKPPFLLPVMKFLPKMDVCHVGVSETFFVIKLSTYTVHIYPAEGRFPQYQKTFPPVNDTTVRFTLTDAVVKEFLKVLPHFPKTSTRYRWDSDVTVRIVEHEGKLAFESTSTDSENVRFITDFKAEGGDSHVKMDVVLQVNYLTHVLKTGFRTIEWSGYREQEEGDKSPPLAYAVKFAKNGNMVIVMSREIDKDVQAVTSEIHASQPVPPKRVLMGKVIGG